MERERGSRLKCCFVNTDKSRSLFAWKLYDICCLLHRTTLTSWQVSVVDHRLFKQLKRRRWTPCCLTIGSFCDFSCRPLQSITHNRRVNYIDIQFEGCRFKKIQTEITKYHCVSNRELAAVDCLPYFASWLAWKHSPVLKIPFLMLKFEFFYSVILLCLNLPWKGKRVLIHFTARGCSRKPELGHRGIQNMKTTFPSEGRLFTKFIQHCRFRRLAKLELWWGWSTSL